MANEQYFDDAQVADDQHLWRRIPRRHFVADDNTKTVRCSSAAFENHPDGSPMSVLWGELVLSSGRAREDILRAHEGFALASFTAGLARQNKQIVSPDAIENEPAHYLVVGEKTKRVRRALSKNSIWEVPPTISYDDLVAFRQSEGPDTSG